MTTNQPLSTTEAVKRIWRLLNRVEKRRTLVLLLMTIVGVVLDTFGISLIIPAVALLTDENFEKNYPVLRPVIDALGNPSQTALVIYGLSALVVVYLIKNCFLGFTKFLQMQFQSNVETRLSNRLFDVYVHQPYNYHVNHNSTELLRNVQDARAVTEYAVGPILLLITELLVLFGLVVLLLVIEPIGSIVVVSIIGGASYLFHVVTKSFAGKWGKERQFHDGQRIKEVNQAFGGIKDVKLLGREDFFLARFVKHNSAKVSSDQKFMFLQQLPILWLEVLVLTSLGAFISILLLRGEEPSAILPVLAVFAASAFRVLPSANRTLTAFQNLKYGRTILDTISRDVYLDLPKPLSKFEHQFEEFRSVKLDKITFSYDTRLKPVLSDINLQINAGESIGIVGLSGAGKSTLIDLLLGLLEPSSGSLIVNGVEQTHDPREWQNLIGYVPQHIFLTDETLRENIAFGEDLEIINDSMVESAVDSAQLRKFIESLPDGLDTIVGERGVKLSGGQRQRIGIARALYRNPPVLILDEATSSLDLDTEAGVMESVELLHGSKTLIIVAHRLSTVQHCDLLFLIEDGQVFASGSFADVMAIYQPRLLEDGHISSWSK